MNLMYCANEGVFDGVFLSILSAVESASCPIHAYIFTMDLTEMNPAYQRISANQILKLSKIVKQYNPMNIVTLIDATKEFKEKIGTSKNLATGYTPYTLLRLLVTSFEMPDYILYVDADTMFCKDISSLEKIDIRDYELAGVEDYLGKIFIKKNYLNAGVLYLNIPMVKETELFDKCIELCRDVEMVFPDQDAINQLVTKKLMLPRIYNEQHKWKKDTVIQHFAKTIYFFPIFKVMNIKQWQIELVKEVLKLDVYDSIYEKFKEYHDGVIKEYVPMTRKEQWHFTMQELKSYVNLNGGIFR